ncbi:serine hydrolase [Immundisolibacter sp.]|uniref:serine hydrolase n=1 Tax=Immundisolibacter sp. TaxID=1934948 RepID=UPI002625DDF2|nr:serine hydrolase [Immundisolibacter sp.]MDD3650050.1 DUF1343 domain-containing protein [Immundisolibacter sp.]
MRAWTFIFLLMGAVLPDVAGAATPAFAAIDRTVEEEIRAGHVPGAVVLVGDRDGVRYRRAFGERAVRPARRPMTADTIFDLASLTKVLATTTAIMQLIEAGRITLDDPLARYWPAFGQGGKAGITVRQLLTHSSGLRPDLDLSRSWSGAAAALALALVEQERPRAAPGTRVVYSDINFIALGELVRRVSGEPLDVYAARHIFGPLGMRDTGFAPPPAARSRIAPTDVQQGILRWGEVQDPTAYRMQGVAGHAGLFGSADDLARFAQMLLGGGALHGQRILSAASVLRMTLPQRLPGGERRGLGWDIASPYAGGQDLAFGPESFGHTGYSGTSLWVDLKRGLYLIILTSRLHPDDRGDARPLRRRLSALVADATPAPVLTGIDVLQAQGFAPLAGKRVGLLTNRAGRDAAGRRTIDVLAQAPGVRLAMILTPEHGLDADQEGPVGSGADAATGVPILSLYGRHLHPSAADLAGLGALVVDLQDVGVRFYTYAATMAYAMQAAAAAGVPVVVLDRPNPITAAVVEGPLSPARQRSLTDYFPMPLRHGMTLGELARMFNAEYGLGARLTVVPMPTYRRDWWYDQTGLAWTAPSPNLPTPDAAILYPGVALVEAANVSVGRGTAQPFALLGAPWIDAQDLTRYLEARAIPGVRFEAADFSPVADRYAHRPCHGVRIHLADRARLDAPRLGMELAAALHRLYPADFRLDETAGLIGSRTTLAALASGADPRTLPAGWHAELETFKTLRAKYLLYP